ncbi:sigma-70 family RNA polymerase sigma factor [Paenibacillus sp. HW567]|uniref:sigma-70 family RNA polymerase sigma factor n=1 Tax=Paenibacillus sp. HW567 TaxID=1034769 RepID=UPI00037FBA0B|nr:sigma-70 family RNA polymerase sigma factor [Paenibacillus sp. HW567]
MSQATHIYDFYRREIYRIGWRVQYQAKKVRTRECPLYDYEPSNINFAAISEQKIWVEQLMQDLPPQGKVIIEKIYLKGLTEAEVAKQLNISQQAVNKWKRKMIHQLSQISNC